MYAAWLEHLVLFFPDQSLDADEHVAFGRRFGTPEIHPYIPKRDDEHPEIVVIDTDSGGRRVLAHRRHLQPHAADGVDPADDGEPAACGGDTLFTNQYLVYETLSAPMRGAARGADGGAHRHARSAIPSSTATHPVVRTHPDTGRKSLFVNRTFTSHMVEMRRTESDALLDYLYTWSEQPRSSAGTAWSEGTIGIWDNRCTQHYAVPDYEGGDVIERVTVIGDTPFGGDTRWQPYMERHGYQRGTLAEVTAMEADPRANSMSE